MTKDEYNCVCCKFEKDGLLCSHILKVMLHQNIDKIPEKYVIDRWRKNDKKIIPNSYTEKVAGNDTLRYNVLSRKLLQAASKGSKSKRKYEYLLKEIDRIEDVMAKMDDEGEKELHEQTTSRRTVVNLTTTSNENNTTSTIQLIDPDVANTKGRPRHLTIRKLLRLTNFTSAATVEAQLILRKFAPISTYSSTYQRLRSLEDQRRLSEVNKILVLPQKCCLPRNLQEVERNLQQNLPRTKLCYPWRLTSEKALCQHKLYQICRSSTRR